MLLEVLQHMTTRWHLQCSMKMVRQYSRHPERQIHRTCQQAASLRYLLRTVTSKQSFGNPDHPGKGNVVCFSYNKSQYDTIKVDGAASAPVPNAVSSGSSNETNCWYVPVIQNSADIADGTKVSNLVVDGKYEGSIIVDTSSTYSDPGVTQGNLTIVAVDTDLTA